MLHRASSLYSHCFWYTWITNEIYLANQIHRADNTLLTDSHEIIYPVHDRFTRNLYTLLTDSHEILFRAERSKTIPCPTSHPCIGHIRQCPPGMSYCPLLVISAFRVCPVKPRLSAKPLFIVMQKELMNKPVFCPCGPQFGKGPSARHTTSIPELEFNQLQLHEILTWGTTVNSESLKLHCLRLKWQLFEQSRKI